VTPSIFYSWQSDSPEKGNRYFIRDCLLHIEKNLKLEDSLRVESDTSGVSGTPDIAATIFQKIEDAEIAVFDVTPVGRAADSPTLWQKWVPQSVTELFKHHRHFDKALPNPNVLIELGYAARAIGWERIICVMNIGYGHSPEELPFDLRSRRFPVCYSHSGNTKPPNEITKKAADELAKAIKSCLGHLHNQVEQVFGKMNHQCLSLLQQVGQQESFAFLDGNLPPGMDRLLDLDIVWCHSIPANATYGYHWTHLGRRVLEEFSRRQNAGI